MKRVARDCREAVSKNSHVLIAAVTHHKLIFGLTRMRAMLQGSEGWEDQIFGTMEEAKAWIRKRAEEKFSVTDLSFT